MGNQSQLVENMSMFVTHIEDNIRDFPEVGRSFTIDCIRGRRLGSMYLRLRSLSEDELRMVKGFRGEPEKRKSAIELLAKDLDVMTPRELACIYCSLDCQKMNLRSCLARLAKCF